MSLDERPTAAGAALYPPAVVPPPQPLPLWRFLVQFVRNPLLALPQQAYEDPFLVYRKGAAGLVWVTDPGLVERILLHEHESFPKTALERRILEPTLGQGILTAEGAAWRWQRRTVAPLFRHQDLIGHVPAMVAAARSQLARWGEAPAGSLQPIDRDLTDATYDVITHTILAGGTLEEDRQIKRAAHRLLSWTSWEVACGLLRLPQWFWHPGKRPSRQAAATLRATVRGLLSRRRQEGTAGAKDLLGRLLAARDPETGQPMSDDQLIDNLLTFLLAGHETTAKALTWALYLAARAPEWQERVRAEVREVCGPGAVAARHLEALKVTRMVLKEAMRLYPPVPVMTRMTGRDLELAGWRLLKGTLVVIPVYAVHRHRRLWSDPDRFDPLRFTAAAEADHLRTQFMPFGFGPRSCIGMAFAMIEATVIFATLIRAARFEWDGRHAPEPVSRVTLRPRGGMPLRVSLLDPA